MSKELNMAEKSEREKKFKGKIPEEAREHYKNARQEMRKSIELLLPAGFHEHRKAARREMLLAWRSMIDAAIKHTEEDKE
jgi:hypothetical protein